MTLAPTLEQEKREIDTDSPWLELYELEINAAGDRFQFVGFHDEVTFDGRVYTPFPVKRGPLRLDGDGRLAVMDVGVSNITQEVETQMDVNAGFNDRKATLRIVHLEHLADPTAQAAFAFWVLGSSVDDRTHVASFRLGINAALNQPAPSRRYLRTRCPLPYKGKVCLYAGALATCDKTLLGANGCVVHGDDEVAAGKPRLHPQLFGGFPGIRRAA